ncbi:MAG: hypothetical protein JRI25_16095, partial [Deltaproteobacteria bacterium]|nr:hypothetical protein [Deltaproteobacteria bacterium]
ANDGRPAWRAILEDNAEVRTLAGQEVVVLGPGIDTQRVDPHPNAFLMILMVSGVPQDAPFEVDGRTFTVADLVQGARLGYRRPQSAEEWRMAGWTLRALSLALPPGRDRWRTATGEEVSLFEEVDEAMAYLEHQHAFAGRLLDGAPEPLHKHRQYIYAHSCGGIHLLMAPLGHLVHPEVRALYGDRARRQVDILALRLREERRLYTAVAPGRESGAEVLVAIQRLKMFGHSLEALSDLGMLRAVPLEDADFVRLDALREWTADAILDLDAVGAYAAMARLQEAQPQTFLDLLGDTAHAVRGLRISERLLAGRDDAEEGS